MSYPISRDAGWIGRQIADSAEQERIFRIARRDSNGNYLLRICVDNEPGSLFDESEVPGDTLKKHGVRCANLCDTLCRGRIDNPGFVELCHHLSMMTETELTLLDRYYVTSGIERLVTAVETESIREYLTYSEVRRALLNLRFYMKFKSKDVPTAV